MAAPDGHSVNAIIKGLDRVEAVTPSANDLSFLPLAVMVSVDATVTMTIGGTSVALPLKGSVLYDFRPDKITAVSTGTCWIFD